MSDPSEVFIENYSIKELLLFLGLYTSRARTRYRRAHTHGCTRRFPPRSRGPRSGDGPAPPRPAASPRAGPRPSQPMSDALGRSLPRLPGLLRPRVIASLKAWQPMRGPRSALTWWRTVRPSQRRPRTHRWLPKMAAATSSETGCGGAAADKRGPLGIPQAVFVVSGGSAGRAAPRPGRGWGSGGEGAALRQPGPSPVRRHLRRGRGLAGGAWGSAGGGAAPPARGWAGPAAPSPPAPAVSGGPGPRCRPEPSRAGARLTPAERAGPSAPRRGCLSPEELGCLVLPCRYYWYTLQQTQFPVLSVTIWIHWPAHMPVTSMLYALSPGSLRQFFPHVSVPGLSQTMRPSLHLPLMI